MLLDQDPNWSRLEIGKFSSLSSLRAVDQQTGQQSFWIEKP